MNIVIISDTGVECYKKWSEVSKTTSFKKDDFTEIEGDYVLNCTGQTYEISKDIRLLETVASQKVFSKDKFDLSNWLQLITMLFVFILVLR